MRFMMLLKANKDTEAGVMPEEKTLAAMGRFNEEMVKAGAMLGGEGLKPSSAGARVTFAGGKPTVTRGPFSDRLICGFWIIQTKSLDEAIDWAKRVPFDPDVHMGGEGEIELRPLFEMEDFAPSETMTREAELREELERRKK